MKVSQQAHLAQLKGAFHCVFKDLPIQSKLRAMPGEVIENRERLLKLSKFSHGKRG